MKTRNSLFLLLFAISLIACSTWTNKTPPNAADTPGTIALNDTLFCDETEVTNFHWLEYLYWLNRIHGDSSVEYANALPQDKLWDDQLCIAHLDEFYLRHPQYRDYPVVGITQDQAKAYSKWRSDRVFEYYLIKNKMFEFHGSASSDDHFTIEGYFDGTYTPGYLKEDSTKNFIRDTSLLFPTYRLPNGEDRKIMIDYVDSTDYLFKTAYPKKEKAWMEEQNVPVYLEIKPCDSNELSLFPYINVDHGYPKRRNIKFLYNIRGNVAEWSSEENMTYGGGWPHTRSYIFKNDTISSSTPNAWTGFRNVCSWSKFNY